MTITYDITVVGDGFAGLMTIANLVKTNPQINIFWAGTSNNPGRGIAYSTTESAHVLNVRADRMGAWSDNINDFHKWLETHMAGQYVAGAYVPRMIYGTYLDTIRAHAQGSGNITYVNSAALDTRQESNLWHTKLANGETIAGKHLVLAPGNPAIGDRGWPKNETYISDFWDWRLQENRLPSDIYPNANILIVGTGLTAIDAAASCRADGFTGRIIAVSPHGRWPQTHADPVAPYKDIDALVAALKTNPSALHYFKTVRAHTADWRSTIDSLRPHNVDLWQNLPEREKARFSRHLESLWNIHRHRIAPEIAATLKDIQLIAGRVIKTGDDGQIVIQTRGGKDTLEIKAFRVINCTGPSYRSMIKDNPILASLLAQKFLKIGPLNIGVTTPDTPTLHVIGTPLRGERHETTAVPELRDQALAIATKILNQ